MEQAYRSHNSVDDIDVAAADDDVVAVVVAVAVADVFAVDDSNSI